MRRPNGSGTIKLLSKRRRKRYAVYAPAIMDYENKKIIQRLIGTFATRQEAEQALIDYNPQKFQLSKLTFKQVYNSWYKENKERIKTRTLNNYQSCYNKNLKKYDDYIFKEFNLFFWEEEVKNGNLTANGKYLLKIIYNHAVKYDIVEKNIIKFLSNPPKERTIKRKEFSKAEIELLKKLSDNNDMAKYLYILIHTGLRISEFLNLRYEDIKQNKYIRVTTSKTKTGENRVIPIHENIKHFFTQGVGTDYIFFNNVKKRSYRVFWYLFNQFNVEYLNNQHTIHDTRHTFASILTRNGVSEASIISMIGHTSIKTTNNIYVHTNLEDLENAMDFIV